MTILGVETSAVAVSAALINGDRLISEFYANLKLTHSTTLMPMIDAVLRNANMGIDEIDVIAVSSGPGSFTGLRIGLSTVKGLCAKNDKPAVPVSSLEGMAYSLKIADGIICPVMDAKRQQVYNALFRCKNGIVERICDDRAISIDELSKDLEKFNESYVFLVGDGADLCYNVLGVRENIKKTPENLLFQRASGVAYAAVEFLKTNEPVNAKDLMPVYLRLPQAERERLERNSAVK